MHFSNVFAATLCALAIQGTAADTQVNATASVNATVSLPGIMASGNVNTSVSGFTNMTGYVPKPRNNTSGMKIKDMYRELDYDIKPTEIRVRSRLEGHADYRFMVSTNNGYPRVRAWFYNQGSNQTDDGYTSTYMVAFARVVEVNDTISWQNSTSYIHLLPQGNQKISKWSNFVANSFMLNDTTVLTANTTFTDNSTNFQVTLATFVSQKSAAMPGANGTFNPNALKYSFGMVNFPYKYVNSHLVVVKALWTSESSMSINSNSSLLLGNTGSQMNWNSTAGFRANSTPAYVAGSVQVDANIVAPNATDSVAVQPDNGGDADSHEKPKLVAFHFIGNKTLTAGTDIWWDPEVAVAADTTSGASPSPTYSGTSGAAGVTRKTGLGIVYGLAGLAVAFVALL